MKLTNAYYLYAVRLMEARTRELRKTAERIEALVRKDQQNDGLSVKDNYYLAALRERFDSLRKSCNV
jgi:hypothetical protein